MLVGKVLLVLQQAQLGVDGATTADNAGDAVGRQGNVAQQHASMNGPVVNTLAAYMADDSQQPGT